MNTLPTMRAAAKARLLQMHFESRVGHIGGNLSCLDMLLVLHHQVMESNDLFILSKGHAAGALYVTLWTLGRLTDTDLQSYHQDDTRLSAHPAPNAFPEIPFATGSLGHGLSLAAGIALGKRLTEAPGRTYCLLSDGEWQEGSNWEALIFAQHHRLPLTLLVDTNGLQGFGTTQDVASQAALTDRFRAFGVHTLEIDGHCPEAIAEALTAARSAPEQGPCAIVAHTRKGCGVSFMENRMEWHYLPMNEAQYRQARLEICGDETIAAREDDG
jgi:transketolase